MGSPAISAGSSEGKRGCWRAISWRPSRARLPRRHDPSDLRESKPRGDAGPGREARREASAGRGDRVHRRAGGGEDVLSPGPGPRARGELGGHEPHLRARQPVSRAAAGLPPGCISHGGSHRSAGARPRGNDARRRGHRHRVGGQDPPALTARNGDGEDPRAGRRAPLHRGGGTRGGGVIAEPENDPGGARRARLLLLAFAAFVVYGSFFPFSFRIDAAEVQRDLARFWATLVLFDAHGRRLFSVMDLGSNILLGVPMGYLLVRGRLAGERLGARMGAVLLLELAFAGTVEIGQIVAPTRTAAALDVVAQVAGALAGALVAHGRSGEAVCGLEARLAGLVMERPALLVAAGLMIVLAADAFY